MKKITILFICMGIYAYANDILKTALFAEIIHVKNDDTLNVRSRADYRSKKITELNYNMVVGLNGECKRSGKSIWCKVYELAAYGGDQEGWVNAHYLEPYSKGFVTVKGYENNCYYALNCTDKEGKIQCLIVLDKDKEAKWIERDLIKGESQFGAAHQSMEGYCTKGAWLDKYLK